MNEALVDLLKQVAKYKVDGLVTLTQGVIPVDRYDGAGGKAVMAAIKALGPDCNEQELMRAMMAGVWWVQTLVLLGTGTTIVKRLQEEAGAQQEGGGDGSGA